MIYKTIAYRRTMQVRAFESVTFEATVEVGADEAPPVVAAALADNVDGWCQAAVDIAQAPRREPYRAAAAQHALDAL